MLQLRRCKTQQITDSLDITEVSEKTETGQSQDKETYDLCQTIFLKKKKKVPNWKPVSDLSSM